MKNLILLTLPIIITLSMSSYLKKWTCTCTHYTQHFGTNGTVTNLQSSETEFFGSKNKANDECNKQQNSNKEHAASINADPNLVNCTLK